MASTARHAPGLLSRLVASSLRLVPSLDYRALFDHAADGLAVVDPSLHVVAANGALGRLLDLDPADLVGRSLAEIIDAEDLAAHPLEVAAITLDGARATRRRLRGASGLVDVDVITTRLPDGYFLCAARAARPRPVELRDSEARFRTVAENLNAGLVITDLENRVVYVNDYFCRHTGYGAEELIGHNLAHVLFRAHDTARDASRLRERLMGRREVYEVEHRRKDGTSFMAEVSASPMLDGDGRLIGTVGVVIDVTAREEWEYEMAQREQRYRTLFEVTPLPACVYDMETLRFLAVNPAAVTHYGYSEDEFLSMTILDVRPPEDREKVSALVSSLREGGAEAAGPRPTRHVKKDGTLIDVEVISHALEYEGRRARMVIVHDVTEQMQMRAMERELGAHILQAQKMEAVGRLAGGVAHDFNNLLSVTLTAATALDEALDANSPLRAEVRDIRDAAERGAVLTRQLLAFGRKETRAPALLDVNDVVTNVERLLARALGAEVTLVVRRNPRPARTVADAHQLEQVLMNLAINARDAMSGGGTVVVAIGERELTPADAEKLGVTPGRYVTLEVTDSGAGMDEETRSRAFEPFFTTKGPEHGTGLGLAAVYGIVRETAGAVTLDSAPGHGTRVTILLPERAARAGPSGAARAAESRRVLLVEDDPRVRAQARRLLERCGYTVFDAADGAEAEHEFDTRNGEVDVVVTDVVMPGVDGVELVSRLRRRDPAVPVVFVSGYTAENRQLPLDDRTLFVPKPYSVASLCEAIETAVAR